MRIFVLMIGLGLMAGCSGSSSGGSNMDGGNAGSVNLIGDGGSSITRDNSDFSDPKTLAPNEKLSEAEGVVTVSGRAVKSNVADQSLTEFSYLGVTVTSSADGEAIRLYTEDGSTIEFDASDLEDPRAFFDGLVLEQEDGDGTQYYSINPDVSLDGEYDYMAFAGWAQSITDGDTIREGAPIYFGTVGNPTREGDMPSGSATYRGESIGVASTTDTLGITTSDIEITTPDYSSVTVRSSNTRIAVDGNDSASGLDYTATGTVSGNGFSASGDGVNINGDFFGPGAAEAGGSFSGTRTYKGETATYGGAFGARKAN